MQRAVSDWQGICNIYFDYKSDFDELSPGSTVPDLDFVVRGINANGAFIAQAFFPGDPPMKRRVLVDPSYYHANFDRVGIFRHELGHVLGARHEHIWSNDEDCKGERVVEGYLGADSLTPYDRYSVMHYLCGNSSGTRELAFTSFDSLGARKLYGPPVH